MTDQAPPSTGQQASGLVKSSQEFGAGLFLIAVAAFAYWQGLQLPRGTLRAMGPGMLPQTLAIMVGAGGLGLVLSGLFTRGPKLDRWSLRGPFFVFGGILLFSMLIRTGGLIIAGPVTMIFGSMATPDFRWKEATIFSLIMTTFCIVLFKILLRLPIPVIGPVLEPYFPF